jgi:hypothetical protein
MFPINANVTHYNGLKSIPCRQLANCQEGYDMYGIGSRALDGSLVVIKESAMAIIAPAVC